MRMRKDGVWHCEDTAEEVMEVLVRWLGVSKTRNKIVTANPDETRELLAKVEKRYDVPYGRHIVKYFSTASAIGEIEGKYRLTFDENFGLYNITISRYEII